MPASQQCWLVLLRARECTRLGRGNLPLWSRYSNNVASVAPVFESQQCLSQRPLPARGKSKSGVFQINVHIFGFMLRLIVLAARKKGTHNQTAGPHRGVRKYIHVYPPTATIPSNNSTSSPPRRGKWPLLRSSRPRYRRRCTRYRLRTQLE